jgi:hypothetical protein
MTPKQASAAYEREMGKGNVIWVDHVICEGSHFHVLWWDTNGEHCSEARCVINKPKDEPPTEPKP